MLAVFLACANLDLSEGPAASADPAPDDDALDAAARPMLRGCEITRTMDLDADGIVDDICVERWRGDERHVLRRDCVATSGRAWGEENEWDLFGCPIRSLTWDDAAEAEVTYECDAHHQVVRETSERGTTEYVNTYDALGHILERRIPGDPEFPQYTDVYWWWEWSPDGRLLADGFHKYMTGSYWTSYTHDAGGALVSSEFRGSNGHYPEHIIRTTYDALGRPAEASEWEWTDETHTVWTYADDAISAVDIRETDADDGALLWTEARSWTCP